MILLMYPFPSILLILTHFHTRVMDQPFFTIAINFMGTLSKDVETIMGKHRHDRRHMAPFAMTRKQIDTI